MITGLAYLLNVVTGSADLLNMVTGSADLLDMVTDSADLLDMVTCSADLLEMVTGSADLLDMITGSADLLRMLSDIVFVINKSPTLYIERAGIVTVHTASVCVETSLYDRPDVTPPSPGVTSLSFASKDFALRPARVIPVLWFRPTCERQSQFAACY